MPADEEGDKEKAKRALQGETHLQTNPKDRTDSTHAKPAIGRGEQAEHALTQTKDQPED